MSRQSGSTRQVTPSQTAFDALVFNITEQLEVGAEIDLNDFKHLPTDQFDRLQELLPTLQVVADLGRSTKKSKGTMESDSADWPPAPKVLGDFQLNREIGRGGMGIVYEAEQLSLHRRVALKVLPFAGVLDERVLKRFKNEALAAAQLDHPHIVNVLAVGEERGVYYYAMRLVDGRSLAELIEAMQSGDGGGPTANHDNAQPIDSSLISTVEERAELPASTVVCGSASTLPPCRTADYYRAITELAIQAAEALEHAHQHGVVHRDIKPANLLLDTRGKLWVTDFGLARIETATTVTKAGDVLGTLRYMSPEQGGDSPNVMDHRSDIYSLGVTLYELLTLRPAFSSSDPRELVRQIASENPHPPRHITPSVPIELETIVLKAIEKEPTDRYSTAQALADDLRSFLENRPIEARRPLLHQRLLKLCRRHQVAVLVGTVLLFLAVIGLAIATLLIWNAKRSADQALQQSAQDHAVAESHRRNAERMADEMRGHLYASDIKLAFQAWSNADIDQVVTRLERHRPAPEHRDLRGFEWYYLWRLCHSEKMTLRGHTGEVYCASYSPDGRHLATASQDSTIKLWDTSTGQLRLTLTGHTSEVGHVAFSPDGKLLASCGDEHSIRLCDAASGRELGTLTGHTDAVSEVVFSPDGSLLASGGEDAVVKFWDVITRQQVATLTGHARNVRGLAFSPDGRILATCSSDQTVKLWDVATREVRATLHGHSNIVNAVAFSRDGQTLASASWDQTIKLWNTETGTDRATLHGHLGRVQTVRFSPTENVLISAGMDGTVRFWDTTACEPLHLLKGHDGRVWCATFAPDGKTLVSAGADTKVKLWQSTTIQGPIKLPPTNGTRDVAIAQTGGTMATSGSSARLWDLTDELELALRPGARGVIENVFSVAVSPDGEKWAEASQDGMLQVSKVAGNTKLAMVQAHSKAIWSIAFSADGRFLGSGSEDGTLKLWNAGDLTLLNTLTPHGGIVSAVAFSPDGPTMATAGGDGTIKLWEVGSWRLLHTLRGHGFAINAIAFSPDSHTIASGSVDQKIKLWDARSGGEIVTLVGHTGTVRCLSFSPDGRTLASGGADRTLRLWHLATAQQLVTLEEHEPPISCVVFSPNGKFLTSCAYVEEGPRAPIAELFLWPAPTDEPQPISTGTEESAHK